VILTIAPHPTKLGLVRICGEFSDNGPATRQAEAAAARKLYKLLYSFDPRGWRRSSRSIRFDCVWDDDIPLLMMLNDIELQGLEGLS